MEMSFFTSCPLTWGLSVPLQTVCTSNSSLFFRVFVRVHLFEAAYRLVFVRPALARRHRSLSLFLRYFRALASITNLCMPGLGQGHGKKRHLHAHSPGNFKELKCYQFSILFSGLPSAPKPLLAQWTTCTYDQMDIPLLNRDCNLHYA